MAKINKSAINEPLTSDQWLIYGVNEASVRLSLSRMDQPAASG